VTSKGVTELKQQREQHAREFDAIVRRGLLLGLSMQDLRHMLSAAGSGAKAQISQEHYSERTS
jgi:hypothetical protein